MIKIIILDNKKCQILCSDSDLLKKLHRHLSYRSPGVEYTAAYQNGWDGITYLLSKTNKFSYGLLGRVKKFLQEYPAKYEIEDKRSPKTIGSELDISANLAKHGFTPREHQIRILNAALNNDRGIIRGATGLGKSICAALIAAKFNKPTIIYVIGLDLLDQFHKLFSKLFDEEIGYIGNGIYNFKRINIASVWSIGRALKLDKKSILDEDSDSTEKDVDESNRVKILDMLKKTEVHLLDECHVVVASTIHAIYNNINPSFLWGLSGTPFTDAVDALAVNNILGEQIINVSASELIEKGFLAQPIIKYYTVPKMPVSSVYTAVYKEYIVENDIRNNMIIKLAGELIDKKYTPLLLFKQIKHGEILADLLDQTNLRYAMLYGNDSLDKRNEIKKKLVDKEIDLILASTIFDIGLDLPELSALILCGGGKSNIRCLQRVGRVIRPMPGKKYAAIVDFYDQVRFLKQHSMARYKVYTSEPGFKVIKSKEMK